MHHGEDGHVVAEQLFVQPCTVAFDGARSLQGAQAAQARWRGTPPPVRQLHIRDSTVILQFPEDLLIDGVEAGGHGDLPGAASGWRGRRLASRTASCLSPNYGIRAILLRHRERPFILLLTDRHRRVAYLA